MSETQTQEVEGAGAPPPDVNPEVEARARRMGWRPKEEFNGRAGSWVDAETFVERGETIMPLLLERNKALDRQVATLGSQLTEQSTLLTDIVQRSRKAEELAYRRARAELEAERRQAVAAGDTESFERADREIQALTPPTPVVDAPKPPPGAPAVDPVVQSWIDQNPWFRTDPEANAVATAIHGVVSQERPNLSLEEKLAETNRRMKRLRPELFGDTQRPEPREDGSAERRRQPPAVSASSSAGGRSVQPRSFDALPADAKAQYPRVVKMLDGKGEAYTKEEHARLYWSQFPDDGA